jgi:hypothetical protein
VKKWIKGAVEAALFFGSLLILSLAASWADENVFDSQPEYLSLEDCMVDQIMTYGDTREVAFMTCRLDLGY